MSRKSAVFSITTGAFLISLVGVIMRILDTQDVLLILFYRSIGLSAMVALFTCLRRRQSLSNFIKGLDSKDLIVGIFLSISFSGYVFSMIYTSVASTLFILSSGPFFTAIISLVWIKEKPTPITWFAMVFAVIGMLVMLKNGLEAGNIIGNLGALATTISFSVMLVYIRKSEKDDVLGGTFLGSLLCCVFALLIATSLNKNIVISFRDTWIILGMGAFTIGLGMSLITWSASHLPAPEVSLFMLTESILGPIWPWLFLGEMVTFMELMGGLLILFSLLILFLFGGRTKILLKE